MLNKHLSLLQDAGLEFYFRRLSHTVRLRLGIIKKRNTFPATEKFPLSLQEWQTDGQPFIFDTDNIQSIPRNPTAALQSRWETLESRAYTYFHGRTLPLPKVNVWHTHPLDGFLYDARKHWTEMADFTHGRDIKWMWERSRFCHLYTVVRHDHHFGQDHSAWVFNEISHWIENNPLHLGPHYTSAQEVALRCLNWLFAVHYYKHSASLTEQVWQQIMCSLTDQVRHVAVNISFSRYLVRNNHLLTEATTLFVFGSLFPRIPESKRWQSAGWRILQEEVSYQFAPDGTYLQYALNYHRVAIQVYTYAISMALKHAIPIPQEMRNRLLQALDFLEVCCDPTTGQTPNYGHNDGSLFFPLNNHDFQDVRPSIQALGKLLGKGYFTEHNFEDNYWLTGPAWPIRQLGKHREFTRSFTDGGYFIYRNEGTSTFIRCGHQPHRPAQADQLHIDIHIDHIPMVIDAGTFTYNGEPQDIHYCFGTASHNTLMLDNYDQMLKGPRFVWFYWTKCLKAHMEERAEEIVFNGQILAFRQTGKKVTHHRHVTISKTKPSWMIVDSVQKPAGTMIHQLWHVTEAFDQHCIIYAEDISGKPIDPVITEAYHSPTYGVKKSSRQITFSTAESMICTYIIQK